MVAGGARWPGLGWRGGEVGMEWWHYLETESFYRNISGSSVTRPHCAHRHHQLGHTTTLHPHTGARNQEPGGWSAFHFRRKNPRRKRMQEYFCVKPHFSGAI